MGAARSGHWSEGAPGRLSEAADRKGTREFAMQTRNEKSFAFLARSGRLPKAGGNARNFI